MTSAPLLRTGDDAGRPVLLAAGAWTADNARLIDEAIDAIDPALATRAATLDMAAVAELDTYGAWLIERLARRWRVQRVTLEVMGLAPHLQGLRVAVQRLPRMVDDEPPSSQLLDVMIDRAARAMAGAGRDFVMLVETLGAVVAAAGRAILAPQSFRMTSMVHQLDRVGWQAVPIILLITFLIGCIIAQQGFFHFRKFGAEEYVVDMVGILTLREIGVLIVTVMVAGRSGSSYTAELGSMKMREEIDALRTMGLDPVDILLLPRVVALLIALPMLTFLGSMSALFGGGLVAWFYGGMSPEIFVSRLKEAISLTHFEVGMIKAPFMALVIGIVASAEGAKVSGSAESLGLATTASVVKAIFLVIVLDGLFAMFFSSIGM